MNKALESELTNSCGNRATEVIAITNKVALTGDEEIAFASIFIYATEQRKIADALKICKEKWESVWQYQHPAIRSKTIMAGLPALHKEIGIRIE